MTEEQSASSDRSYGQRNPGWHREDAIFKAEEVLHALQQHNWAPSSIADLGCGSAEVVSELGRRLDVPVTLTAWDPAPIEATGPPTHPSVRRLSSPVPPALDADLVLLLDVLEHLEHPESMLRAARDIAPKAIIRLPLELSVLDRIRPQRLRHAREVYGHLHHYTTHSALALLRRAGWRVMHREWVRVPWQPVTSWHRFTESCRHAGMQWAPRLTVELLGGWSLFAMCQRDDA
ncbi:MAG: methyltransferase domain-containing protein [Myxococcota bacterium]